MRAGFLALVLFAAAASAQRVTEGESHIASAFTSGADPGVLADNVRLGPALRGALGREADSRKVYDALVERVSGKALQIRLLSAAEAARHATLVGSVADPLILVQAGEVALLMQYAPRDKNVTFVEQLSGAKPRAAAPLPKPAEVTAVPLKPTPPPVVEKPKPAPRRVAVQKPQPVVLEKPVPVSAPPRPTPKTPVECVIKPVMSDDDLRACGAR
jgi:hypothetical protein